jgi:hypothetical protein
MTARLDKLCAREDRKRELAWDARHRWRAIQDTIAWGERQQSVRRNTPENRVSEERAKRAGFSRG